MSDKPAHRLMYFSGVLTVHGSDAEADARWKLIADALAALGCGDVMVNETERYAPSTMQWCDRCWRAAALAHVRKHAAR